MPHRITHQYETEGTKASSVLLYKLLSKLERNSNAMQANVPVKPINMPTVFSRRS